MPSASVAAGGSGASARSRVDSPRLAIVTKKVNTVNTGKPNAAKPPVTRASVAPPRLPFRAIVPPTRPSPTGTTTNTNRIAPKTIARTSIQVSWPSATNGSIARSTTTPPTPSIIATRKRTFVDGSGDRPGRASTTAASQRRLGGMPRKTIATIRASTPSTPPAAPAIVIGVAQASSRWTVDVRAAAVIPITVRIAHGSVLAEIQIAADRPASRLSTIKTTAISRARPIARSRRASSIDGVNWPNRLTANVSTRSAEAFASSPSTPTPAAITPTV